MGSSHLLIICGISILCIFLLSEHTEALSIDVDSTDLIAGQHNEINVTLSSANDEDLNVQIFSGRPDHGGSRIQEKNITVEAVKDVSIPVNLTPRLGENPLFVTVEGTTTGYQDITFTLMGNPDYSDVLLIINNNSAVSKEIGDHFLGYHDPHVLFIDAPAKETISRSEFDDIREQIEEYLETNNLTEIINYIITTKGVPLRVSGSGNAAFDSELTLILGRYASYIGGDSYLFNPYYGGDGTFTREDYDIFLVTRLTGYTAEDAKALIDHSYDAFSLDAVQNLTSGWVVVDVDPGQDRPGYQVGNDWLRNAANISREKEYNTTLDHINTFLRYQENVTFYSSWGSNDGHDFIGHGKNTGVETDGNSDGVPDNWIYEQGQGNMNRTAEDKRGGHWSVRIIRDKDTGESALFQKFIPGEGKRYYLRGYANLSGISGDGGVHLQIRHYDSQDNLIEVNNGSLHRGTTTSWISLSLCHLEPVEGTDRVMFGVVVSEAEGTVYLDDIQLVEIVPNNDYVPGAIAETFVSTSARSFTYPTGYSQSLIADIIRSGVTGVKGYCYEPYLDAIAHPDILFDRYSSGRNLAESYYSASIMLSWMDVVVGDPKLAPFALLPDLTLQNVTISADPDYSFNQSITLEVENRGGSSSDHWNLTVSITDGSTFWNHTLAGVPLFSGEHQRFSLNWSAPYADSFILNLSINHSAFEQRKANNQEIHSMDVLSPPDLVPRDFSLSPDPPQDNAAFQLTISVLNSGETLAQDVNLTLYVDDVIMASTIFDAPGLEKIFCDFSLLLPSGDHSIRVIADSNDKIHETNESNNEYVFQIHVNIPPVAVIEEMDTTRVGIRVILNGSQSFDTDGNISQYLWDIRGQIQTGMIAEYTFISRGNFTINLTVQDDHGAKNQTSIIVEVANTPPVPVFYLPESILSLDEFTFDARPSYDNDSSPITYQWDFGDGDTSTTALTRKSYQHPGTYIVTLTVTDDVGENGSLSRSLAVENRPPIMDFTIGYKDKIYPWQSLSEIQFLSHTPLLFNFSKSQDPDGIIETITTVFEDGTNETFPFPTLVTHSFSTSGTVNLTMTLVDDFQGKSQHNFTFTIYNEPPRPTFSYFPTEPESFQEVQIMSTSKDNGKISRYSWEVDDDTFDTEMFTYAFKTYGFHTIILTIWDDEGLSATFSDRIYVNNIPAEIQASDQYAKKGKVVRITWTATDRDGGISRYVVTFPDGAKKEARKPYLDHTFNSKGTYELNITVYDDMGASNSTTITVFVRESSDGGFLTIQPFMVVLGMIGAAIVLRLRKAKRKD